MIYLVDPTSAKRRRCVTLCDLVGCTTYCGIKPLYGIDPPDA